MFYAGIDAHMKSHRARMEGWPSPSILSEGLTRLSLFILMKIFLPLSAALIAATSLLAQDRHRPIDPDEAYKNNCMRCHTSVQEFSPRMTRTILMHKRVRARLTAEETKAIQQYLDDNAGPKPVRRRGK